MYNLPSPHISFSQYDLWKSSPKEYVKRYFEKNKPLDTVFIRFGKEQHKKQEENPDVKGSETKIECYIDEGLKLLGYIDSIDEDLKIIDFKFSKRDKYGKAPWDKVKVRKHAQFPFYCMMIREIYGRYNPLIELHWYETEFIDDEPEYELFQGKLLPIIPRKKKLVSKDTPIIFPRIIEEWELDTIKQDIIKIAKEISEAYTLYQLKNK